LELTLATLPDGIKICETMTTQAVKHRGGAQLNTLRSARP
jgi:hypothetical protein